jgi:hypothetical protein
MVRGFACVKDGEIDIRTVQHSEVGAMVNGLVLFAHVLPTRGMSDGQVKTMWKDECDPKGIHVVPVKVVVDGN